MTSTSTKKTATAGFTLLEVLVALGILATALFIVLDLHYSAMTLFDTSRQEIIERNLMRQALGMAEADLMAGTATGSGDFGKRYPEYKYSYDATAVGADTSIGLYDLLVTLEGPGEKREMHMFVYYMGSGATGGEGAYDSSGLFGGTRRKTGGGSRR